MNSFTIFEILKREVRFTKFEVLSLNESIITITESAVKQFKNKQMIFVHGYVHKRIYDFYVSLI